MEAVRLIRGQGLPLDRADVDTDQIIPAEWLKRVERTGFEAGLFSAWRQQPDFVLNRPEYAGATVLMGGANFGCGSSREHAVWALQQHGFQAVIAPGFADIFRANATKNGLLPVQVDADFSARLMAAVEADPGLEISIDVAGRSVQAPSAGLMAWFSIDDITRHRFLEGLDDIALTLLEDAAIGVYEQRRQPWLPTVGGAR